MGCCSFAELGLVSFATWPVCHCSRYSAAAYSLRRHDLCVAASCQHRLGDGRGTESGERVAAGGACLVKVANPPLIANPNWDAQHISDESHNPKAKGAQCGISGSVT